LSGTAAYIIGMLIIVMSFTYLSAQLEASIKLIVIGDIVFLISGISGGILMRKKKKQKKLTYKY